MGYAQYIEEVLPKILYKNEIKISEYYKRR